ncbi:MAG: hypothetical protein V2J07_04485 [Anaerolineae bacterium]|jgi:uridine kinase|nr:hypothetical protein [Anaerolineae bacterium]
MKPLMIGIAGGSASGKSTFLRTVVEAIKNSHPDLNIETISTDRYFYRDDRIPKYVSPAFQQEIPNFNHPEALYIPQLLEDLESLQTPDIVLVEGHLLFHYPDVREKFDIRLFIDLNGETRALRRMVRNLEHHGDPIPDHSAQSIASYYLESAHKGYVKFIEPTKQYADLILRGDADFSRVAKMINAMVQGMLQ